jgi:hypothetical protein
MLEWTTLHANLSRIKLPDPDTSSLMRVLLGEGKAISSMVQAIEKYESKSVSLDEGGTDVNQDHSIYLPLTMWYQENNRWLGDLLSTITNIDLISSITLDVKLTELLTRIDAFITDRYPHSSAVHFMFNTGDTGGSESVTYSDENTDSEVDPDNYQYDDILTAVGAPTFMAVSVFTNVIKSINNLIFRKYNEDYTEPTGSVASDIIARPATLVYSYTKDLTDQAVITALIGSSKYFMTAAQWAALSSFVTTHCLI